MTAVELDKLLQLVAPTFKNPDYILSYISIWPIVINILAACFCLGCSATFHLMSVKSPGLNQVLARLDYGGICALIAGTSYTVINFSFACDEVTTPRLAFTLLMVIGSSACFIVCLLPFMDKPEYASVRAGMFITLSLSIAAVFVYLGNWKNDYQMDFSPLLFYIGGVIYITGAVLYAMRVPERCNPGKFDLCGASH